MNFPKQLTNLEKIRILFTQDALINAGAEKSHLELISRFSDDTEAALVYFYPKHDLMESYQRAGIRLFFLDIPESYHFLLAICRFIKLIRLEKPDLIVSCLWRADIITRIASIITGVPVVGTLVNDSYCPMAWKNKNGFKHRIVFWLDRMTAGIPVHWIANAHSLAESHIKVLGLKKHKISIVYRGRKIPEIQPRTEKLIRNFISYGRLLERKGFHDAIQAFAEVVKAYPDCSLTIYGEGPYRPQLERLTLDLGLHEKVFLPGKIPDPHLLLQLPTSNCFLFPSWYEGFSGALVEAMLAGIPIIASDIPMNLEAICDEKSALVYEVGKVVDLSKKMIHAIQNPEQMESLGNTARYVAGRQFNIEQIAKVYENVLKDVFLRIDYQ